jgi:DNA-directed RNA polymerase subunit alpha
MRVGKRTDYDKVTLEIITDGSITPQDAFAQGVDILMKQFSALTGEMEVSVDENNDSTEDVVVEAEQSTEDDVSDKMADAIEDALPRPVTELTDLSTRTLHVLEENKIMTIGDIVVKSEEEILALDGMGQKGVKEIKKAIGTFGITLS